ncbi:hypothetical protein HBI56_031610 [Parastagonospora nodorum]|nr:hypothetical protein HBH51_174470 [Parastagonospora nodorum]KAH3990400.1 hypothetical protein HBH52_004050 [Parastagonospora nodorum]KAH4034808.1 hypothetical protein HBI09_103440 [Parastagonospora nodorum]KAH4059277.1 hypothetical protein HBH49_016060 [Parastagonospora nodorum]KAH4074733.1 hypothetical protein HBH50_029090 [Parastagonospora nodorum]
MRGRWSRPMGVDESGLALVSSRCLHAISRVVGSLLPSPFLKPQQRPPSMSLHKHKHKHS